MKDSDHGALILADTGARGNDASPGCLPNEPCDTGAGPSRAENRKAVLVSRSVLNELTAMARQVDLGAYVLQEAPSAGFGIEPDDLRRIGTDAARLCAAVWTLGQATEPEPEPDEPARGDLSDVSRAGKSASCRLVPRSAIDRIAQLAQVLSGAADEASGGAPEECGAEFQAFYDAADLLTHAVGALHSFPVADPEEAVEVGFLSGLAQAYQTRADSGDDRPAPDVLRACAADLEDLAKCSVRCWATNTDTERARAPSVGYWELPRERFRDGVARMLGSLTEKERAILRERFPESGHHGSGLVDGRLLLGLAGKWEWQAEAADLSATRAEMFRRLAAELRDLAANLQTPGTEAPASVVARFRPEDLSTVAATMGLVALDVETWLRIVSLASDATRCRLTKSDAEPLVVRLLCEAVARARVPHFAEPCPPTTRTGEKAPA